MAERMVPKEFNDANIRVAREFKARAEAAEARLASAVEVIEMAHSCLRGETPEDCSPGEAEDYVAGRLRDWLLASVEGSR
jgi:hypothetical protein